jgi:2-amino-4-hydroxy-6-hydroxymethyldihydropteridine diphosphokinase
MVAAIWYKDEKMSASSHQVCLLLGSNIEPEHNLPQAVTLLQRHLDVLKASSVWESASVDCCYPDYLNMALVVATSLTEVELKHQILRPIEAQMGRVRTDDKNASRTIDIDIILYDDQEYDPDLWLHAHRAVPVSQLFPDHRSESGLRLADVAHQLTISWGITLREDISISLA